MKTLLTTFLFFISSFYGATAQAIEGIGIFKINTFTIDDLKRFSRENSIEYIPVKTFNDYVQLSRTTDNYIAEFIYDSTNTDNVLPYFIPVTNCNSFKLASYEVAGIKCININLRFRNDTLYYFKTDASLDIHKALELKYGNPELDKTERDETCSISKYGAEIKLKATTFYSKWYNKPKNIKAVEMIGHFYDSNCEKKYLNSLFVSNEAVESEVRKTDEALAKKRKESQKTNKLKSLSDF